MTTRPPWLLCDPPRDSVSYTSSIINKFLSYLNYPEWIPHSVILGGNVRLQMPKNVVLVLSRTLLAM